MRYVERPITTIAGALLLSLALASCSVIGQSGAEEESATEAPSEVVLITHESFVMPEDLKAQFEEESGLTLEIKAAGDAGTLTNKLVLTQGNPTGDVAFGIDNTFASRALDEGVFATLHATLTPGAARYQLAGDAPLAPIDQAGVCVNIDNLWFAKQNLTPPTTLEDLTKPEYRDLMVLPGAATSSPGMAFLLSTIAEYGDEWPAYWERLMANGAKLTAGWSDAYYVDFTQGGENGKRPIVLSYDSSPAFTVPEGSAESTTSALLETCFQQVEYAGILAGANNPKGAAALVEFMLGKEFQAALPDSMYVFPVREDVELPEAWAEFAIQAPSPFTIDAAEIAAERDTWLQAWTEVTTR